MKRGYYVCGYDEEWGVAVVAESISQAKTLAYQHRYFPDDDWIEIKARWVREADISGLSIGIVEPLGDALQRGFYQTIEGICEGCGFEEPLELYNGSALCVACILERGGSIE